MKSRDFNSYPVSKSEDVRNLLVRWQLLIWSREANDAHKLDSVGLPGGESVTRHLSKGLRAAAFLSITIVALAGACNHPGSIPEGATVTNEVSHALIGKQITIHGKFSLRCKLAACILLDNHQVVYLNGSREGTTYSEMEGKLVTATGILRFYHSPNAEPADRAKAVPVARAPDHFYFDETAQLRLISP